MKFIVTKFISALQVSKDSAFSSYDVGDILEAEMGVVQYYVAHGHLEAQETGQETGQETVKELKRKPGGANG